MRLHDNPHIRTPAMLPLDITNIEVWNEGLISAADWRDLRNKRVVDPDKLPTDYKRFLAEEHHHFYGRPWCIGRTYFEFLHDHGLQREHHVLDFGCGAGRLGIWLIPYLERSHYVGVDHHWIAIDAFARYEIPLHGLAKRSPRLILDDSLSVKKLQMDFDVILDCYVSLHLKKPDRLRLYRQFAEVLRPGGRIFLPHQPTLDDQQLSSLGFFVTTACTTSSPFLAGQLPEPRTFDHWHVLEFAQHSGTRQTLEPL